MSASERSHDRDRPGLGVRRVRKAFEQVADQLRELVVTGALLPGDRLPTEAELSAEFRVSRATVREALRLLSAQGLVRTAAGTGGGSYVTVPTIDWISELIGSNLGLLSHTAELSLDQLLEAREVVEVPAARLAAQRRTEDDLRALRETVPEAPLGLPIEQQYLHNRDFHFRLVEASGNPLLSIAAQPVFSVLHTHLRRSSMSSEQQRAINEDHRAILDALEAGDGDLVAEHMRRHLAMLRPGYERGWRSGRSA